MAARDTERYYWLKLDRGFFKRHDITVIESMPNGRDYVLLYLKLMCESVDHEGALRFSDAVPYTEEMLSSITHLDASLVHSGLELFKSLQMIEVFDDETMFIPMVADLLDSETYAAKRKREQRKDSEKGDIVPRLSPDCPQLSPKCPQEKEIEKEIETEKESEQEKEKDSGTLSEESVCRPEDVRQVVDAWQTLGIQKLRKIPDSKTNAGKMLRARIRDYGVGSVLEAIEIVRASDFLMGRVKDFQITFDWFVRPNNFLNIVNGKYDNRDKPEQNTKHGREMQGTYNTIERWVEQHADDGQTV